MPWRRVVGSGVGSGTTDPVGSAVGVAGVGVAAARLVAPATAMLSGLRVGRREHARDREEAAMTATAAMPMPARERRAPERRAAGPDDPSRRGGIGGRAASGRARWAGSA